MLRPRATRSHDYGTLVALHPLQPGQHLDTRNTGHGFLIARESADWAPYLEARDDEVAATGVAARRAVNGKAELRTLGEGPTAGLLDFLQSFRWGQAAGGGSGSTRSQHSRQPLKATCRQLPGANPSRQLNSSRLAPRDQDQTLPVRPAWGPPTARSLSGLQLDPHLLSGRSPSIKADRSGPGSSLWTTRQ